ncbi:hypothetical protein J8273_6627 [Carpediemonas membranifera]|uniref:Uncharacterized protein n=1 Tax=Carpediemonas membranifera TaxID=201153 RepID=A0A8J6E0M4_9EUKA|nr:hypothetical protein J8273_6627 [Carpediemonas membranifera]|eukprot:KAG9392036.1 hypothetical protein J8273_6627 [Carpediemonas membranifera]
MVRHKYRYLYIDYSPKKNTETMSKDEVDTRLVAKLHDVVLQRHGARAKGLTSRFTKLVYHYPALQVFILRIAHASVSEMEDSLRYRFPACTVIHKGGTIRSCRKKAIEHHKGIVIRKFGRVNGPAVLGEQVAKLDALD